MKRPASPLKASKTVRVAVESLREGACLLSAENAHYVTRVHRMQEGQVLTGFDPVHGTFALGSIVEIGRSGVRCEFASLSRALPSPRCALHLVQGIAKSDKPDRVIRAATQLGAASVRFVQTERSVVLLRERAETRLARWRAIALDAARQSGRPDLPELGVSIGLDQALLQLPPADLKVLFALGTDHDLGVLMPREPTPQSIVLLIGPEGGFAPSEERLAEERGFVRCRLTQYVLRSETAAVAALAAVQALVPSLVQPRAVREANIETGRRR